MRTGPVLLALLAALAPAMLPAQSGADRQRRQVREVIVFGDDPCPVSSANEVVVCARRPDGDRFRVPENLRTPAPAAARNNLRRDKEARDVSATGPGSCSPVGPGGATGCLLQEISRSRGGMDGDEDGPEQ